MLPRIRKKCPWVSHFGFLCTRLVHEYTYLSPTLSLTRQTSWTKNNNIEGEEAKTFVNVSTILNADVDVCVTNMVDGRSNSMQNAHVTLSGCLGLLKRKWGLKEKVSTLPWSNKQGQKRKLYWKVFVPYKNQRRIISLYLLSTFWVTRNIPGCRALEVSVCWEAPSSVTLWYWVDGPPNADSKPGQIKIRIKYLLTLCLCGHKHL